MSQQQKILISGGVLLVLLISGLIFFLTRGKNGEKISGTEKTSITKTNTVKTSSEKKQF